MMVLDAQPAAVGELPAGLGWACVPHRTWTWCASPAGSARWPPRPASRTTPPRGRSSRRRTRWPGPGVLDARARLRGSRAICSTGSSNFFSRGIISTWPSRRIAAVALAVRLYRADHAGRWPESLGELVPTYLPAVPIDPFAAGGRPLRYLRDTPGWDIPPALAAAESSYIPPPGTGPFLGGPVVYSVGQDGIDDGGSRRLRPTLHRQHTFSFDRADWQDLVVPLAGNPEARNPNRR